MGKHRITAAGFHNQGESKFRWVGFSCWILIERVVIFSLLPQDTSALANVALNLALIPQMAGQGAAIATVVSYIAASYLSLAFWDRTRPVFTMMSRSLFMPWRAATRVIGGRLSMLSRPT